MAKWSNPADWQSLLSGATCPICVQGKPLGIIAELETAYLTSGDDTGIRGYCCLMHKRHVVELHDLSPAEGAAFMRDIQIVSAALARFTQCVKLNYEIHGNTIPHLHVHFFPRYVGDPFEDRPIDPKRVRGRSIYALGEFDRFAAAMRTGLAAAGNNPTRA
jgi:diadenosine tetraphosphate (Ap4A) HIT family hydrolase